LTLRREPPKKSAIQVAQNERLLAWLMSKKQGQKHGEKQGKKQPEDDFDAEASEELEEMDEPDEVDADNEDAELDIDDIDDIDDDDDLDDVDDEDDEDSAALRAVEKELSQKDQNARSLAIRREIERRAEQRRLAEDLDYLDLDLED
jgi:hypothetical protein